MRTGTRVGIHVKVDRFCPILTATRSVQQILVKQPNVKYNFKNPFRRFPVYTFERTYCRLWRRKFVSRSCPISGPSLPVPGGSI